MTFSERLSLPRVFSKILVNRYKPISISLGCMGTGSVRVRKRTCGSKGHAIDKAGVV